MTIHPKSTHTVRDRRRSIPAPSSLSRQEIIREIQGRLAVPQKQIRAIFELMLDDIIARLASGGSVELRNIGVFRIKKRRARLGRNPKLPGSEVVIPPQATIRFRAGKELLERLKVLPG